MARALGLPRPGILGLKAPQMLSDPFVSKGECKHFLNLNALSRSQASEKVSRLSREGARRS